MVEMLGNVFLPGDCLNALNQSERCGKTILGPGLKKEDEEIRVTKPGILRFKEPSVYWIDTHQKRVYLWILILFQIATISGDGVFERASSGVARDRSTHWCEMRGRFYDFFMRKFWTLKTVCTHEIRRKMQTGLLKEVVDAHM